MTTTNNTNTNYLDYIECSEQPLDFAFHPKRDNIVAAALVDGTLEVHDIQVDEDEVINDDDGEEEQPESILSSTALHTKVISSSKKSNKKASKKIESCRCIEFSFDGKRIYTGGSSGSLYCVDSTIVCKFNNNNNNTASTSTSTTSNGGLVLWKIDNATTNSTTDEDGNTILNTKNNPLVCIKSYDKNIFATGDDNGGIRVWDERRIIRNSSSRSCSDGEGNNNNNNNNTKKLPDGCIHSWKLNDDYISDIEFSNDGKTLLATSADGRLAIFHLQRSSNDDGRQQTNTKKQQQQQCSHRLSDDQEDELLSIKIMKNSSKVVCGTQQGVLSIFSWGVWGDCSDRFPGHPSSIESLLKIDEDTLLTGSSDGLIRVVQIQPDKLLGILNNNNNNNNEEERFPIEKLDFNSNKRIVGSISSGHDNYIRLWDASILHDDENDDENEEEEEEKKQQPTTTATTAKAAAATTTTTTTNPTRTTTNTATNSDDEWDGMDDDDNDGSDSDDSDSDDSDDSSSNNNNKKKTTTTTRMNDKRKDRLKTENEKFFDDL